MKILLINPPRIEGGTLNPNTGLLYIASYIRKNNFDVKVLDLQVQDFKFYEADIIGISTKTPSIYSSWDIAKKYKKNNPNTQIVLGGPHVTALPEESLKKDFVDIIVRREGEETFLELVKAIKKNKNLKYIKGISYKTKGNKIIHNKDRPFIKDLDKLPFPAYDIVPINNYEGVEQYKTRKKGINIITSRGCPYNCNFCYKSTFGNCWRARSAKNVVEEIKYYIDKFKIKEIGIWDDLFNFKKDRVKEICSKLKKENLDFTWCLPNGVRVDHVDEELLREMKKSGCNRIDFGFESGNQEVLDKMGKGITINQSRTACKIAKNLGYITEGFFVIGNIYETKKTMQETIDFACSLPLDYASFMIATPFPSTPLYNDLIKRGWLKNYNWDDMSHADFKGKAHFETNKFTKKDVEMIYKKAFRRFYLRPKILAKNLFNIEHWKNIKDVLYRVKKELLS